MVDCHMHMVLDGVDWKQAITRHKERPQEGYIREKLRIYRDKGFTYLRDGGDRWGVGRKARELAPEYGITYRTPLSNLCKAGHYGSFIGETFAHDLEFAAKVRQLRADGADFIKIMISGLMDFDRFGVLTQESLPSDEITRLVHIAHEEGMSVMVHGNGPEAVTAAARAGVDSVEHGAYLNDEALHGMQEAGTVWVPTLSTVGNLRGTGRFSEPDVAKILASAMENVSTFAAMGGLIAPGSDAGAWAVPHGITSEYTLLEETLGVDAQGVLEKGIQRIRERF